LIVVNIKLFIYDFGRTLNGQRLLRAFVHRLIKGRGVLSRGVFIKLLGNVFLGLLSWLCGAFITKWLLHLKQLNWWKELSLCQ
jgi:hypothetical protein